MYRYMYRYMFWDATKNMDDLDEQRKPIAFEDLHSTSRKLIRRVIKEYKTYVLEEKDEDAEKAMCCNPLLANIFEGLFKDLDAYDDDDISRVKTMFVEDMVAKFSNKQVSRLGTVFAKQTGNSGGTTDSTPTTNSSAKPKKKYTELVSIHVSIHYHCIAYVSIQCIDTSSVYRYIILCI